MRGTPFNYFSQGAAASEVEVDCLTGDCRILRTDISMDVGSSINPVQLHFFIILFEKYGALSLSNFSFDVLKIGD